MECVAIGDRGITCRWAAGEQHVSPDLVQRLHARRPPGVTDVLAAFDSVTVLYDPVDLNQPDPLRWLADWVGDAAGATIAAGDAPPARTIDLPVHYGGENGPDLDELARTLEIPPIELIRRHASACYTVAAVGFLPGFAYLDGLPAALQVPRRDTPRTRVPAGSVAIGGPYTGVYPVPSPGGWHLIGRTPLTLFDSANPAAVPFRVGDRVRFVPQPSSGRGR